MQQCDLVIKNGRVMDPASNSEGAYQIGVRSGKIAILAQEDIPGARVIDAAGLVVSPGFVDIHTHVDGLPGADHLMARLGVTTAIGGNCGAVERLTQAERQAYVATKQDVRQLDQNTEDLASLLGRIDKQGYGVNLGMLAGATQLRWRAGARDRMASAEDKVPQILEAARADMAAGAFGVSFGLAYAPGTSQKELVELFRVAAQHGGIVGVHPRYFGSGLPGYAGDGIAGQIELINAARATGAKLQISHLAHQIGFRSRPYDDLTKRGLEQIEEARASGVDVMADCLPIPYNGAIVSEPFMDIVLSPAVEKIYGLKVEDVLEAVDGPYKGMRLTREMFIQARKEAPNTRLKIHLMREDLVVRTLLPSWVMVSNDSSDGEGNPAQPKILGRMVRELCAITLMEALYKMSAQPAQRLGLVDKGRIAVGANADLVLFDPETVAGIDGYPEPNVVRGIEYTIVNGVPVVEKGQVVKDAKPGKALRYRPW